MIDVTIALPEGRIEGVELCTFETREAGFPKVKYEVILSIRPCRTGEESKKLLLGSYVFLADALIKFREYVKMYQDDIPKRWFA